MPLINTSVPNLIQGVSQQPNSARFAGQCEEQENALSSVAEGLKKRPNTRHVARLIQTAIDENSFVHFINRSDAEKYVVIHDGSKIQAWNMSTGNEATINDTTGGYATTSHAYLNTTTPRVDIEALTIADTTLLLNKDITVAVDSNSKTPELDKQAFVFVKQPDYGKNYTVEFGEGDTMRLALDAVYPNTMRPFSRTEWRIDYEGSNYLPNTIYDIPSTSDVFFGIDPNIQAQTDATGVFTGLRNGTSGEFTSKVDIYLHISFNDEGDVSFDYPQPETSNQGNLGFGSVTSTTGDSTNAANARSTTIIYELFQRSTNIHPSSGNNASVNNNFDVNYNGNGLSYELKDSSASSDFAITTRDDLADSGIAAIYKETDSLSSLPLRCINGFTIKVIGDAELDQDDYYVKFVTGDGSSWSSGSWVETAAPDHTAGLNSETLPYKLVSNDVDEFTIEEITYNQKTVGDSSSNPMPSFVNNKISNMFFFKNRLGFLSNEHVIMSEAGHFYNFFRTTVTSLLDSAPIDVAVSSGRVTNLKAAKVFQENLVLFSDNTQFVLKGGDILTAKTVSVSPVTNFSFADQVEPLPLGSYIYFPFTRGAFTGMREFSINAATDVYDSVEVTEHVPAYIPKNIIDMAGTTSEDMIVLLSADEKGSLYIYNYFWNNNQKVLSAWSKFTFTGEIRGIEFIESTLYIVIVNSDETHLVQLPLESGLTDEEGFNTLLDMRTQVTIPAGSSSFTLPYKANADDDLQVYTKQGSLLRADHNQDSVQLERPVEEDTDVWVGLAYNMKYVFSEQVFKQQAENTKSPTNSAKTVIRNGSLFFDDTGAFTVKINSEHRDPIQVPFTSSKVGTTILNTSDLDSGVFRFSVGARPDEAVISVENNTALPCKFQSAEFESFAQIRSSRYS